MSAAILLGDLTLVASEQEFAGALATQPVQRAERARAVFDLMRTEVTVGQYLDVLAQALPWGDDPVADERRSREVIRAKAARYSVEHPIALGAALADADEADLAACRALGLPLGEAFQLRDDLLGVFGDPATTGKPAGDDLREGKRTVLTARAVARARAMGDDATVALLRTRLGDRSLTESDVTQLADAIKATGAARRHRAAHRGPRGHRVRPHGRTRLAGAGASSWSAWLMRRSTDGLDHHGRPPLTHSGRPTGLTDGRRHHQRSTDGLTGGRRSASTAVDPTSLPLRARRRPAVGSRSCGRPAGRRSASRAATPAR